MRTNLLKREPLQKKNRLHVHLASGPRNRRRRRSTADGVAVLTGDVGAAVGAGRARRRAPRVHTSPERERLTFGFAKLKAAHTRRTARRMCYEAEKKKLKIRGRFVGAGTPTFRSERRVIYSGSLRFRVRISTRLFLLFVYCLSSMSIY
ncbi:hypothetical protein EVAR_78627_1 [Eumeta japonica]|uniref:Uncharacterized protein n=1 Tax=Eumeta variegata TaxID=151549 RepID=A0A4C1U7Y3_EUMVA|nr:hypothetical protein EVAR_78627_1 [Eumeta japonica]